jgi:hypothetical protein
MGVVRCTFALLIRHRSGTSRNVLSSPPWLHVHWCISYAVAHVHTRRSGVSQEQDGCAQAVHVFMYCSSGASILAAKCVAMRLVPAQLHSRNRLYLFATHIFTPPLCWCLGMLLHAIVSVAACVRTHALSISYADGGGTAGASQFLTG